MTATLNYLIVATLTFMPAPAVIIVKIEKQSERRSAIVVRLIAVAVIPASAAVPVPIPVTTVPALSCPAVPTVHLLDETVAKFGHGRGSAESARQRAG